MESKNSPPDFEILRVRANTRILCWPAPARGSYSIINFDHRQWSRNNVRAEPGKSRHAAFSVILRSQGHFMDHYTAQLGSP